jgi:hypothetical protein
MYRQLGAVAGAMLLVLAVTAPTLAAGPDVWRDTWTIDLDAPSASAACGFVVHRHEVGSAVGAEFADGTFAYHARSDTMWSANGRSVAEHDAFTVNVNADGTLTAITGAFYHVTGQAVGSIQLDVGRMLYDADGDLLFSAGPAPSLERDLDALCAALAP